MFVEWTTIFAFIVASIALVVMPGPSVTLIIANSVKHGTRAGLLNIAGGQLGLLLIMAALALGLEALTTTLAWLFDWLRLLGAAYLIWLGYKLLRSDGRLGALQADGIKTDNSHFWQGFFVSISNPKTLLFFGAFIPQFLTVQHNTAVQVMMFGLIFMAVAAVFDGVYAFAAGRAGTVLSRRNVRTVERAGGGLMLCGGAWLALSKS